MSLGAAAENENSVTPSLGRDVQTAFCGRPSTFDEAFKLQSLAGEIERAV
jgi:hypothetical protein